MKHLIALMLCLTCVATVAQAGGPVVVVEAPEPEADDPAPASRGFLPWLIVPLVVCVVFCGPEEP